MAQAMSDSTFETVSKSEPSISASYNDNPEKQFDASDFNSDSLDKSSRRDIEQVSKNMLQALNSLHTPEEKIAALCKRYADLLSEHKQLQNGLKTMNKKQVQLGKERDKLHVDYNKAVLAKSKLETLCRELQRQNKEVKEESIQRSREDEQKRKEVSNRFQSTIDDVQQKMGENQKTNQQLREENLDLCKKLKAIIEERQCREEQIEKVLKVKQLESELMEAKLQEVDMTIAEERQKFLNENKKLLTINIEQVKRNELLTAQHDVLSKKLLTYTSQFEEFQSVLGKSNEVLTTFKTETDTLGKKIKKLEKESHMWKKKWENCNQSTLQLVQERSKREKELELLQSKVGKLEKLCRALQEERNKLAESGRRQEREIKRLKSKLDSEDEEGEDEDSGQEAPSNHQDQSLMPSTSHCGHTDEKVGKVKEEHTPQSSAVLSGSDTQLVPLSETAPAETREVTPPVDDLLSHDLEPHCLQRADSSGSQDPGSDDGPQQEERSSMDETSGIPYKTDEFLNANDGILTANDGILNANDGIPNEDAEIVEDCEIPSAGQDITSLPQRPNTLDIQAPPVEEDTSDNHAPPDDN